MTYEPHAAITYLKDDWNLTAHAVYDFNTASAGHTGVGGLLANAGSPAATFFNGYRSGDLAFLELTTTKKFGEWQVGPVGYYRNRSLQPWRSRRVRAFPKLDLLKCLA